MLKRNQLIISIVAAVILIGSGYLLKYAATLTDAVYSEKYTDLTVCEGGSE